MRILGYEIRLTVRRVNKDPAADARQRLLDAVANTNRVWAETRERRMWLNLWLDWSAKELQVRRIESVRYTGDEEVS